MAFLGGNPGTKRGSGSSVSQGNGGASVPWTVTDDNETFETQNITLVANTDTTITFSQPVRLIHIKNWDTTNPIRVKDGAITSNTDSTSSRIGPSPLIGLDNDDWYPFKTTTIHVRSAGTNDLTIIGFY